MEGKPNRLLRMYIHSRKKDIPSSEPVLTSLAGALAELDDFPTYTDFRGGFIGFISESGEVIQFIRFDTDAWFIDVPVVKGGDYTFSRQNEIPHDYVKKIVESFYSDEDWKKYFAVPRAMPKLDPMKPFKPLILIVFLGLGAILVMSLLLKYLSL